MGKRKKTKGQTTIFRKNYAETKKSLKISKWVIRIRKLKRDRKCNGETKKERKNKTPCRT
jgi:hypothetical protein